MGLVLQHVRQTKSGSWEYRRRVPKDLAGVIPKREFKRVLGDTRKAALAAYPAFHAAVDREIANARRSQLPSPAPATELEAYAAATLRVADLASGIPEDDGDEDGGDIRGLIADQFAGAYPLDPQTDEPLGAVPVDRHAINLLRNPGFPAPPATLEDAVRLYLPERHGDGAGGVDHKSAVRVRRDVGRVAEALGRPDPVIADLTREDARRVWSHLRGRMKGTGEAVSSSTPRREMNTIRAVVSYAIAEHMVPATFRNPFDRLTMGKGSAAPGPSDKEKRDPLPAPILSAVRLRILAHAAPDLALIWRLLEGTGARLGEVTGLLRDDVVLTGLGLKLPHLWVRWNENRRIKTVASQRAVPLTGDALAAAVEALGGTAEGPMLFSRYGRLGGADAASAALMKHLRRVTLDPRHTVHSLRHNMADRLDRAKVSALDRNLILGHALGGVGERVYGGTTAQLEATTEAMRRAEGKGL